MADRVINESKLPVLIVPDKTTLKNKIHTTVFVTDYHDSDLAAIKFLSSAGKVFSSRIIIEKLFITGITMEMFNHSHVPLLVFRASDSGNGELF